MSERLRSVRFFKQIEISRAFYQRFSYGEKREKFQFIIKFKDRNKNLYKLHIFYFKDGLESYIE